MKKPHICFITQTFSRQDSLIVQRQGKSLVESGYKVSFILCDGKPDEEKYGIEMKSIDVSKNIVVHKFLSRYPRIKSRYEQRLRAIRLKRFLKDYDADIFQVNEFEHLAMGKFLKKSGKKVVFNLREYYPIYYAKRYRYSPIRKIVQVQLELRLKRYSKFFDAVFSCMPEMHTYIHAIFGKSKYFEDVANFPVVDKNFSLSFEEYVSRNKVISYFGSIYNISCQEIILEAIERIPNVTYLLAGVFYDKKYQQMIMKKPAWKQVHFINGFAREDLPDIINRSIMGNVVKDFSKTETPQGSFSIIKIFETMEAAVPVILSRVPIYEQIVDKYKCGICVNPHDVDEFYNAIKYIIDHPYEAYQMGQNARQAVLDEYSWDKEYIKYQTIINKILENNL